MTGMVRSGASWLDTDGELIQVGNLSPPAPLIHHPLPHYVSPLPFSPSYANIYSLISALRFRADGIYGHTSLYHIKLYDSTSFSRRTVAGSSSTAAYSIGDYGLSSASFFDPSSPPANCQACRAPFSYAGSASGTARTKPAPLTSPTNGAAKQ